jgi:hypothetical protein
MYSAAVLQDPPEYKPSLPASTFWRCELLGLHQKSLAMYANI